jgi:hypothetical protein
MRRALAVALPLLLVLLVPPVQASALGDELNEVRFERFVFTFTWNKEDDLANVVVDAKDLILEGDAARELRSCIDGGSCAVPGLSAAAAESDTDGDVTEEEVESFALYVQTGMQSGRVEQLRQIKDDLKKMVKFDNYVASSLQVADLKIRDAEGGVGSTEPISISVSIIGTFPAAEPADSHKIWIQRRQANFTVADQFIVQAGKGWRINEDSIKPDSAASLFDDGKFAGTQDEFESTEPLQFDLQKAKKSPGWGLLGSLSALGVAALLTAIIVIRRRKL